MTKDYTLSDAGRAVMDAVHRVGREPVKNLLGKFNAASASDVRLGDVNDFVERCEQLQPETLEYRVGSAVHGVQMQTTIAEYGACILQALARAGIEGYAAAEPAPLPAPTPAKAEEFDYYELSNIGSAAHDMWSRRGSGVSFSADAKALIESLRSIGVTIVRY